MVKTPSLPRSGALARRVAIPEIKAMRELHHALARGGLSAVDMRTPEDCARIAAFYTMVVLLRLFDDFKRRIEGGEDCRLVMVKRSYEPGRLSVEIAIESRR